MNGSGTNTPHQVLSKELAPAVLMLPLCLALWWWLLAQILPFKCFSARSTFCAIRALWVSQKLVFVRILSQPRLLKGELPRHDELQLCPCPLFGMQTANTEGTNEAQ